MGIMKAFPQSRKANRITGSHPILNGISGIFLNLIPCDISMNLVSNLLVLKTIKILFG